MAGIILGMLLMGFIADQIGRKWGSVLTSAFMFIGGILLTASSGKTIQGWAIMFAVAQVQFSCLWTSLVLYKEELLDKTANFLQAGLADNGCVGVCSLSLAMVWVASILLHPPVLPSALRPTRRCASVVERWLSAPSPCRSVSPALLSLIFLSLYLSLYCYNLES